MKKLFYANIPDYGIYIIGSNNHGTAYTAIQDVFDLVRKEDIKELEVSAILFTLYSGKQVTIQAVPEDTIESVTKELYDLELQESKFGSLYTPVAVKIAIAKKKEKLRKLNEA